MMSTPKITSVMYHYVRPLEKSRFPKIKGLNLKAFEAQIDYLVSNYTILEPRALRAILKDGQNAPKRSCILTFDDGYIDHFNYVFPILATRGLKGFFFPPKSSLMDRKILNVNKIQFLLAEISEPQQLKSRLDNTLADFGIQNTGELIQKYYNSSRYDSAPINYIKKLLQHALPDKVREKIIDRLFNECVTSDTAGFCEELYLTLDQAKLMADYGMEFGGHGDLHLWHDKCTKKELEREVSASSQVVRSIHGDLKDPFYCYPFGGYDQHTLDCVKAAKFMAGFTVEPNLTNVNNGKVLELARLDTNDLPSNLTNKNNPWLELANSV